MIKGTKAASSVTTTRSYPNPNNNTNTNANSNDQLKKAKLRELGKIVRGGVSKEAVSFVYLSNSGYNHDTRSLGYGYRYLLSQ
jgi:hypothetical protein